MIEDVEEVSERFVVVRRALENQFGARNIECAETACETEEVDRHLSRAPSADHVAGMSFLRVT